MKWELLDRKDILDFDGFWTEYSLYVLTLDNGKHFVCIFGDSELYNPDNAEWDFDTENLTEAVEWFNDYDSSAEWEVEYEEDEESYVGWAQQDVIDMYRRER